jgi:hypothetical protein
MKKYRIIAQDDIDALAERVAAFVAKEVGHMGHLMTMPEASASLFDVHEGAPRRKRQAGKRFGGKSIADWIYESVSMSEFSPSDAAEVLKGLIPDWATPRAVDSIRVALIRNPEKFEKLENGKYKKKAN